jgi:hypothetical protein
MMYSAMPMGNFDLLGRITFALFVERILFTYFISWGRIAFAHYIIAYIYLIQAKAPPTRGSNQTIIKEHASFSLA